LSGSFNIDSTNHGQIKVEIVAKNINEFNGTADWPSQTVNIILQVRVVYTFLRLHVPDKKTCVFGSLIWAAIMGNSLACRLPYSYSFIPPCKNRL